MFDAVKRKVMPVPSVRAASACSIVIVPLTPGDVTAPIDGDAGTRVRPVAASNAVTTSLSGPIGMAKLLNCWAAACSCAAPALVRDDPSRNRANRLLSRAS